MAFNRFETVLGVWCSTAQSLVLVFCQQANDERSSIFRNSCFRRECQLLFLYLLEYCILVNVREGWDSDIHLVDQTAQSPEICSIVTN